MDGLFSIVNRFVNDAVCDIARIDSDHIHNDFVVGDSLGYAQCLEMVDRVESMFGLDFPDSVAVEWMDMTPYMVSGYVHGIMSE